MPQPNHFRHQTYSKDPPTAPYELMEVPFPAQPGSKAYVHETSHAGAAIDSSVDAVYLIHGTFAGTDALGWTAQIEKLWPNAANQIRDSWKKLFDVLADDAGNYTQGYSDQLQSTLPNSMDAKVRLFHWSGENNHVGRVVAAIELLDLLFQRSANEKRVLFFCHSHAGNVLAIVSNLLGADESNRDSFFDLIRPIYRDDTDKEVLERVSIGLGDVERRAELKLDIVTLGTPIRYGWDAGGYRNLLHFVHHVPVSDAPEFLSPVPELKSKSILKLDGDFVQQFGIAGTNFFPYLLDLPLLFAEQKLGKVMQPMGRANFWEHIKMGMRVADAGTTLLIHYDNCRGFAHKLAGHAVYTQTEWMAFHIGEIARRFYGNIEP